jgi:hypothetical protein
MRDLRLVEPCSHEHAIFEATTSNKTHFGLINVTLIIQII